MPLDENPFIERLRKMPLPVAICAVTGTILGAVPAAIVASHAGGEIIPFLLLMGGGFCLGIMVGVTLDTLVFKPMREKQQERRRHQRHNEEDSGKMDW